MAVGQDVLRLMNNARLRLAGATDDVLQAELFNTLDEFLKGSNTWQQDIEINIPANDPANTVYELVPDSPSLVDKLMWVYSKPATTNIARGNPIGAAMSIPGCMTLTLQPTTDVTYIATVSLTVQDPVTRDGYVTFPSWVLARYREVILNGLLGKMMSQPAKPYTNTQMSVFHLRKFNSGKASARVEVTRNNKYRTQAWVFPCFAGGSQRGNSSWGGPV
jgi:hypothetical protein